MGSFFANLQLRLRQRSIDAVAGAVRAHILATGRYLEAAEGDRAHREVLFAMRPGSPWLSVYDQAENGAALRSLGLALATASEPVVTIQVADSDHLALSLYGQDGPTDHFETGLSEGDARAWTSLLVDGATTDALRAALDHRGVFVEEALHEIADLVGIDAEAAMTGHRYLSAGHAKLEVMKARTLRFQLVEQPSWERREVAEGPPVFILGGYHTRWSISVGRRDFLQTAFRNAGGPSAGLSVMVYGPACDAGLIVPRAARVGGCDALGELSEHEAEGGPARYCAWFDVAHSPGTVPAALDPSAPPDAIKAFVLDQLRETTGSVRVELEGRRAGADTLLVQVTPRESGPDGACVAQYLIEVE